MSVARKIFAGYSVLIILMGVFMFAGVYTMANRLVNHLAENRQDETMDAIVGGLEARYVPSSGWSGLPSELIRELTGDGNGTLIVKDRNGKTAAVFGNEDDAEFARVGITETFTTPDGTTWTVEYTDSTIRFAAVFRYAFRDSLVLVLGVLMLLFAAAGIMFSYGLSKQLTAPLRRMIPVLDELGKRNFGVKADASSNDEFGIIAAAVNAMSAELERSEQTKRNMTADIAHELRTPLAIVSGKLEYLQHRSLPVQPEELLPLQDELIRLDRLVSDLKELSQAEGGRLVLHMEEVDLAELLARVAERVGVEAEAKGIQVKLAESGLPVRAWADRHRTAQILLNLVINGIRYTPEGGEIRLSAGFEEGFAVAEIADNGIGIEEEHLPHLFERFYRTDRARSRDSGGSGLGLAIAAEYAKAQGGGITVQSRAGQGTTFKVKLHAV